MALTVAMEAVVIALVCLSPWAFGSVVPEFEFILDCGVALLLLLWAVRLVIMGWLALPRCPVAFCLAGLFLLGVWQTVPLPPDVLERISPATARLYERLLPAQPELIGPAAQATDAHAVSGRTISLYPQATRRMLLKILSVFALFAVVRTNLAPAGALRRLGIAVLVNGALLSVFGVAQFCTSPHDTLYWYFPSRGTVFGPFVDRDHFAFYINLCIGLGLGLLLSLRESRPELREGGFAALLRHSEALWILVALALMFSATLLCLCRGGVISLSCAAAVCVVLSLRHSLRFGAIGVAVPVTATALAIGIFFAYEPFLTRLSTLWTGTAYQKSGRISLLSSGWPIVKSFPLWGTGYGTFRYLEPLYFHTSREIGLSYEHAHDEYLEGLIEGGAVRLGLTALAFALVYRLGLRAIAAQRGKPAAALGLGAIFSFTTMTVHSLGEFGLHIPAIALLATVVAALLCGLHDAESGGRGTAVAQARWWGLAPAGVAAICALLAFLLVMAGGRLARVESLRNVLAEGAAAPPLEYQIAGLEFALDLAPNDADLHVEVAQAHLSLGDEIRSDPTLDPQERQQAWREHQGNALRHFLLARDLCPLLTLPHVRIAANRDSLSRADDRGVYLARAKFLAPADPQLWYFCGLQELADEHEDEAWSSWRRSLALSDRFLERIVDQSVAMLGADGLLHELLPDDPAMLSAVALHVYPRREDAARQRPFFEKALALLEDRGGTLQAEEWSLKAGLCARLGKPAEAVDAWHAALALRPLEIGWRYELAGLLHQQHRDEEARRELRLVLDREPGHSAARQLSAVMAREADGERPRTTP